MEGLRGPCRAVHTADGPVDSASTSTNQAAVDQPLAAAVPKLGPEPFLSEGGQEPMPEMVNNTFWRYTWTEPRVMQPFGGPMGRVAWAGGRRVFRQDAIVFARKTAQRPSLLSRRTATELRCSAQGIYLQSRLFYSHNPPKQTEPLPIPNKDPETNPRDSAKSANLNPSATELPSVTDSCRSDLNQRFSQAMDNLQARVLTASQTLNDITGYSSIEGIKKENDDLEVQLAEAHVKVRNARQAYKTSNTKRATTQREVTTLLARKDTWSPVDLERFTELYRADHVLEGEVSGAQEALTEAEAEQQSLSQRLNAGILKRYHEEQIWSDRIRRASTWGTWGLMGMNFILFVVFQFFAEPWRRRRLVKGVVEGEKRVLEEVRGELEAVKLSLANKEEVTLPPVQELVAVAAAEPEMITTPLLEGSWKEFMTDPARWQAVAADLVSERRAELRMKDASALVLQGAALGAAVAGSVVMLLVRRA